MSAHLRRTPPAQYVRAELERYTITRGTVAVFGQLAILLLIVVTARRVTPILPWVSGIAVALLIRAVCQVWWKRRPEPPAMATLRIVSLLPALAWSLGLQHAVTYESIVPLMFCMVVFSGLVAASVTTFAADPPTFHAHMGILLGSLTVAILAHGTDGFHGSLVLLVLLYAAVVTILSRQGYRELIARIRAVGQARESEERVAREREFLGALLGSSPVAIATLDRDGVLIAVNPAFQRLFGYRSDEAVGRRLNDLIVPPGHAQEAATIDELVESDQTIVTEAARCRKDGTHVTVRISAARASGAAQGAVFALYDDITATRTAEHGLREAEAKYRQLVESSSDLVWQVDCSARWTFLNHTALTFFGRAPEDLLGRTARETVDPADRSRAREGWEAVLHGQSLDDFEVRVRDAQRGSRHISFSARPILDERGRVVGASGTARDVTERANTQALTEEARRAAEQADRAKGAFLANMSHEIRTPFNGILGMVELLLDGNLEPEQRRAAELIRDSGEALLGLLNDVLDLTKIQADRLELERIDFDLAAAVDTTARLFSVRAAQRGLRLTCQVADDVPVRVVGDPGRLRQVLNNLVGNALKFTEHGEVCLGLSVNRTAAGTPLVRFEVRDTGIGIPADRLPHIFEEFVQADSSIARQYGGTGLGLAISRRLVGLMDGHLIVESVVGRGTVFSFELPMPDATGEYQTTDAVDVRLADLRALVVDDNAVNLEVIRDMLTPTGMALTEAASAESGIAALREGNRTGRPYDLAILDAQMPDRDGWAFAEEVRRDQQFERLRLMLLTSAAEPGDGQRCRELGITGYFPKPVSRADLLEAVSAIARSPARAEASLITRHSIEEGRRKLRVLLAEDNPVNQEVAATMLRRRGHDVDVVSDGAGAVQAATTRSYDVVLMDLQMPGMDGLAATRALRGDPRTAGLPIVALSAHAGHEERDRCFVAGMSGYLSKPFRPLELFASVEGWDLPLSRDTEPPTEVAPPVDLTTFRRAMSEAGVEHAVTAMLEVFLRDAPGRLAEIEAAVASGRSEEVEAAAHAYKSACATLAAHRLATLLRETELAGRNKDLRRVAELLPSIRTEHHSAVTYLSAATTADRSPSHV
jgi:PAS domain S-box-containing protein